MRTSFLAVTILAALGLSSARAAQPLLPAGGDDQVPTKLVALPAPKGVFERAPVSFAWALDPAAPLADPAPTAAVSREFWQTVDAAALAAGMPVTLTASGALIRVSPARGARALAPERLQLRNAGGAAVPLRKTASDAELQAA